MIKAVFVNGFNEVTTTESLTQWDYGRKLCIEGLDYYNLPEIIQVHFCDRTCNKTIVRVATKNDTCYEVSIPDKLLENQYSINAFIYIDEGTRGETIKTIHIPVIARKQPEDYVDTGDERVDTKLTELQAAINELNNKFARVYGLEEQQLIIQVCDREPKEEEKEDNVLYVFPDSDYENIINEIHQYYYMMKSQLDSAMVQINNADELLTNALNKLEETTEIFDGYAWNRDLVVKPAVAITDGNTYTPIHTFNESVYNRIFEIELYFFNGFVTRYQTFKLNIYDWLQANAEDTFVSEFYLARNDLNDSNGTLGQYFIEFVLDISSNGATLKAKPYYYNQGNKATFVGTVAIHAIYEIRKKVL